MKVHIKYYAKYVDYTGTRREDVEIERMTLSELLAFLKTKYPRLKEDKSSLIAINDKFERDERVISDGDTISIFPPVSGG
ncbi:MAG: MoaD/ThiS family protein [Thermoplasmatales archaeon]